MLRIADWLKQKYGSLWNWQSQQTGLNYVVLFIPILYVWFILFLFSLTFYALGWVGLMHRWSSAILEYTKGKMVESGFIGKIFWLFPFLWSVSFYILTWTISIADKISSILDISSSISSDG